MKAVFLDFLAPLSKVPAPLPKDCITPGLENGCLIFAYQVSMTSICSFVGTNYQMFTLNEKPNISSTAATLYKRK